MHTPPTYPTFVAASPDQLLAVRQAPEFVNAPGGCHSREVMGLPVPRPGTHTLSVGSRGLPAHWSAVVVLFAPHARRRHARTVDRDLLDVLPPPYARLVENRWALREQPSSPAGR
ncbi:hypothetical protein ACTWP5_11415 [Streptomyces sp. 4N509B]|uniref:hypothetical protein n=1 Tax=Streptomyces sp. 4N509B TaxID=3457413 RepID=UPI003FD42ECD